MKKLRSLNKEYKFKETSRGPQVNMETCIRNISEIAGQDTGRFDLILLAAERSREIKKSSKNNQDYSKAFPNVTALLEIQNREFLEFHPELIDHE